MKMRVLLNQKHTNNTKGYTQFYVFFLLNLVFLGSQYAITFSNPYLFTKALTLPNSVYFELSLACLLHVCLYGLLSLLQTFMLPNTRQAPWNAISQDTWIIIIWSLSTITIITANTFFYPHSIFGKLFALNETLNCLLFYITLGVLSFLFINASLHHLRITLLFFITVTLVLTFKTQDYPLFNPLDEHNAPPNIILIGIDSLSQSAISEEHMPHLSQLLKESVHFENTVSPLARTYPAWITILTGLYPKNHGAMENLVPLTGVKSHKSIAWMLQKEGYRTIYATDEKRFSNIDETFGFQTLVGPKFGINDIILGTFNDFPLSNLWMHSFPSATLFPYNYMNRASHFSYYPERFDKALNTAITYPKLNAPLFLAVHFTLPHWPYTWAKSPDFQGKNALHKRYQASLERVDVQIADLIDTLKQQKLLDNSLLVVLSDHGESFYKTNSRPLDLQKYQGQSHRLENYFKTNTDTAYNKSAGHGSDLLSPEQYHSLLAFQVRKEGLAIHFKKGIDSKVALTDIAPTIYEYLLKLPPKMDGISLFSTLINPSISVPERHFFLESGMYPNQDFSKERLLKMAKKIFTVKPKTGNLEIQKSKLPFIKNQKLYGITQGDWLLTLYPYKKRYLPVIFQLNTGLWSDDPSSAFAQESPFSILLESLEQFNKTSFTLAD